MTVHKMTDVEIRVRDATHQRKTDASSVVLYDGEGRWVLEMYCPLNGSVQVGSYRIFFEDVMPTKAKE
jgi:hypothetical protein